MPDKCQHIPTSKIDHPRVLLRAVDKRIREYLELRDSIERHGLHTAILVRPKGDRYEVVAGNRRLTACKELRLPEVPCIVRKMSDREALVAQIEENDIRLGTSEPDLQTQLYRLKKAYPGITLPDLCGLLCKPANWAHERLGLTYLRKEYLDLIDIGKIPLDSGIMLGKLPQKLQDQYVDAAINMPVLKFKALVRPVVRDFWQAVKQQKLELYFTEEAFQPVAFVRSLRECIKEFQQRELGTELLAQAEAETAEDGFYTCLQWVLNLDPKSIEKQRQFHDMKQHRDITVKQLRDTREAVLAKEDSASSESTSSKRK